MSHSIIKQTSEMHDNRIVETLNWRRISILVYLSEPGPAPSQREIAGHFSVSVKQINDDLAYLRRCGYLEFPRCTKSRTYQLNYTEIMHDVPPRIRKILQKRIMLRDKYTAMETRYINELKEALKDEHSFASEKKKLHISAMTLIFCMLQLIGGGVSVWLLLNDVVRLLAICMASVIFNGLLSAVCTSNQCR